MPNDSNRGSLRPLPKSDRQDELEELSITALRGAFPVDRFRVRQEPGKDRGADVYLEAKTDGQDTNCRAQVQLKATDSTTTNADGTVSVQVSTASVNYLLNGPCPMYFLWIEPRKELRYLWAREEAQRLEKENLAWWDQETLTLRFGNLADAGALASIHQRIIREARFHREILEKLARSTESQKVTTEIDKNTLETTDPSKFQEALLANGMAIVASGFPAEALRMSDLLDPSVRKEPEILLVRAYAQYTLGRYHLAAGELAEAALRRAELSGEEEQLLDLLRLACDYCLGRIDRETYLQEEAHWAGQLAGAFGLSHRLEALRYRHLVARDPERRGNLRAEMERIVEDISADDAAPAGLKLNARICLLYAQGQDCVFDFLQVVKTESIRRVCGFPSSVEGTSGLFAGLDTRWQGWRGAIQGAVEEARELSHPILTAEALFSQAAVLTTFCSMEIAIHEAMGTPQPNLSSVIDPARKDAEFAVQIFSRAGCLRSELRAKLILADLFELEENAEGAVQLAEGVAALAEAMQYSDVESHAREHIEGKTVHARLLQTLQEVARTNRDDLIVSATDAELEEMAREVVRSIGLPMDRAPNVVDDFLSAREIAKEREQWCTHLELLQDLGQQASRSTMYREKPMRKCRCTKRGFESKIRATEWETLIGAFKNAYCQGCNYRQPKSGP